MKKCIGCILLLLISCGSDSTTEAPECAANETLDPIIKECVRVQQNPNNTANNDNNVDNNQNNVNNSNNANNSNNLNNVDVDMGTEDLGCMDDIDQDGQISIACGGTDCDDTLAAVYDGAPEACDELDNDCDTVVNNGLDCSFFAHSDERLYRIDPFLFTSQDLGVVPNLFDIDTHPDGTLYGITSTSLFRYDGATWIQSPQELGLPLGDTANGMAIDNSGNAFITTKDTLSTVNLTTGRATRVGSLGIASSSGDCVVNKGDQLFMTSDHTAPDSFVTLDAATGTSTSVGVTSSLDIWALTAAWGRMYGLTSTGELIQINEQTGTSEVLHTFAGLSFFGAASTPDR